MKIKFLGVPNEAHETIHMYGVDFPLGKVVTLDENDPKNRNALHKLPRHPHFEVVGDRSKAEAVAASLGDPAKEAQRVADAAMAANVAALTEAAEADKAREAQEIAEQERIVSELAASEQQAETEAAAAEIKPRGKPGPKPQKR